MNRLTKAIDQVVELGDRLLEAAQWDAPTVHEHNATTDALAPAWREAVEKLRAANEVLEQLRSVDVTHTAELNCSCCGMLFRVDVPTTGIVQLVHPGFARDVVLQEGIWKGRAMLLESAWAPCRQWGAGTTDDTDLGLYDTRDDAVAAAQSVADHGDPCVWVREVEGISASWARRQIGYTLWAWVDEAVPLAWCAGDCGELAAECRQVTPGLPPRLADLVQKLSDDAGGAR